MQAYITKRRYKDSLPKPHLPDGSLQSGPVRKFMETLLEKPDPKYSFEQHGTWTHNEGRWKGSSITEYNTDE